MCAHNLWFNYKNENAACRVASRLTLGAMRHKEFNWKVHVDLWKLRAKFTRLATQIGQGDGMREECKVGGGEVGGRGGSHLSRLHLEIPWRFLSLFAFRFIFFHNSYIFFLGLFSLLYRSFLSGLPSPRLSVPPSHESSTRLIVNRHHK